MASLSIKEVQQLLSALETLLDDEDKEEVCRIAEPLVPIWTRESARVKDHMREVIEADGSRRDAYLWVPLPWKEAGLPFPLNKSQVKLYAYLYAVCWCLTVRKQLHTSLRELQPLMTKAIEARESVLEEYAQMRDMFWNPAMLWLPSFINNGAGALADLYFKKAKQGRILLADSAFEVLTRVGYEAAQSAIESIYREEGSPYRAALEIWQEVIDSRTSEDRVPPPSAVAEILTAGTEFEMKVPATFFQEVAQKNGKTRRILENAIVASMGKCCEQLVAEFNKFGREVEVDEDLRSIVGFDMRKALAREIILDSKRRKQSIAKLCEEASLDPKFVRTFGEELGYLQKRGRPKKLG